MNRDTVADQAERDRIAQLNKHMAQRLFGMLICAILLLTATAISGWIVTW
jgi:hypothetical protein|tara:strand:+ start:534 stop:683 length:150 start_codon:yes stop_codon:yes gene_type:complete